MNFILILFGLSLFFIIPNNAYADEIRYNLDGEAAAFALENNSAKVRITMDTAFLSPHLEKPERFTISLESDDKLHITSFKYGDAVGGTSEIVKTQLIDIALIKTYSDLENTTSFTDVQNLSITTDKLLINPLQDVTASIYSDTVSVSSSHNIAFPDATKFSIGIPKGSSEYYIVFSDDAEIIIDGIQYAPVDGWKDKAVILTLDSIGLRSFSTTGNFFIESQWKDLKINWQEKFDFVIHDIKGELSIDEPKILSLDLARADDVILQDVLGEVTIKKLENTFQISSRGIANSIEHNDIDILNEKWQFLEIIYHPVFTAIASIGTIIFLIIVFFKSFYPKLKNWRLDRSNRKSNGKEQPHEPSSTAKVAEQGFIPETLGRLKKLEKQQQLLFDKLGITSELIEDKKIGILKSEKEQIKTYHKEIEELQTNLVKLKEKVDLDFNYVLKLANTFFYMKEDEKAIELIDKVLKIDSNNVDALNNKGAILTLQNKFDEAIKYYDTVLEIEPDHIGAITNKGFLFVVWKNYSEATKWFEKALDIDPKHVSTLNHKGILLANQGKHEEAIRYFEKALKINPKYESAFNNKGLSLATQTKYEDAIVCYNKAIEIDQKYPEAFYNKGLSLAFQQKYEDAIRCFDKALEIDPEYLSPLLGKGNSFNELYRYEDAITCYDKSLEINPKYVFALTNKGHSLHFLKRYEEAISSYDKALEIEPKNAKILNDKGISLQVSGKHQEALDWFNKSLQIEPKNSKFLADKGFSLTSLGKHEEAISCYDSALDLDPKNVKTLNDKGISLAILGKHEKAMTCFNESLEINPNNIFALTNKGNLLVTIGRYNEALTFFEKALEIDPKNQQALKMKNIASNKLKETNKK